MFDYFKEYQEWVDEGSVVTERSVPEEVKWYIICYYAKAYDLKVLVETGTAVADTLLHVHENFDFMFSFELMTTYFNVAAVNLRYANVEHVQLFNCSSASPEFRSVVWNAGQPQLFYLDAHFSGEGTGSDSSLDTPDIPVREELEMIVNHSPFKNNVIIIDDARCFKGQAFHSEKYAGYPSMEELNEIVEADYRIHHEADAFVLTPKVRS